MSFLRGLFVVATALFAAVAAFGFAVQHSLSNTAGFQAEMVASLDDPAVMSELQNAVGAETTEALNKVVADGGFAGAAISTIGVSTISESASDAVKGESFRDAWGEWTGLLHSGLSDNARGVPNADVEVNGQQLSVSMGPLVAPLLGDGFFSNFKGVVDQLLSGQQMTLDVGYDLEARLRLLGDLAEWRWVLVGLAAACLIATSLLGSRKLTWLGSALFVSGLAIGVMGLVVVLMQTRPVVTTDYPELSAAVSQGITNQWPPWLFTSAAISVALGLVVWFGGRGRNSAQVAPPA